MVEVIDFNNLMKEERVVVTPPVSQETIEAQNKSFKRTLLSILVLCAFIVPLYFFIRYGGGATDEGALKYNGIIKEIFSDIKSQYPNFKGATCTEGNQNRNDCIEFTFVFYPNDDPATVGTVMSPVDKAFGVSETDLVSLKATMKQMVEVKHQYMYGRRAPLSILVLSSNMSRGGVIEETKMECKEKGNEVACNMVR